MMTWTITTHETLDSTQRTLADALYDTPDLPEGYGIQALEQTAGYGRHGRVWHGGDGNFYVSFLLRPRADIARAVQLSLVTGVALLKAMRCFSISTKDIVLKWPNDILIDQKKCAGILIESVDMPENGYPAFVVGVGVNLLSAPMKEAVCLNDFVQETCDPDRFKERFFSVFSECYKQWLRDGFTPFEEAFMAQTYPKDTHMSVKTGHEIITGLFKGIDPHGNLELLCDKTQRVRRMSSGDIF